MGGGGDLALGVPPPLHARHHPDHDSVVRHERLGADLTQQQPQLQPADVRAIVSAFEADHVVQESMVQSALQRPPRQFNVIDPRSALKIDFWLLTDDPFEQAMFARRLEREVLGITAWIATPEDVILHKLYWDRLTPSERQLGDAAGIVAIREQSLDVDYLREHAKQLAVSETLERLLAKEIRPKAT